MKYLSLFILTSGIMAQERTELQDMDDQWKALVKGFLPEAELNKALTESNMGLIADYGCWCYFEENHGQGRGQPVDEIDTFCKTLHEGYECIIMDSVDAGIPCIPWEAAYTSPFGFSGNINPAQGLTDQNISDLCDALNVPSSCSAMTCKVEAWFVFQYAVYTINGGIINASLRHVNNLFDPATGCPTSPGQYSAKSCCGNFPTRYSFKNYEGARDCCGSHTFNTNMFQCCNDGTIGMICN